MQEGACRTWQLLWGRRPGRLGKRSRVRPKKEEEHERHKRFQVWRPLPGKEKRKEMKDQQRERSSIRGREDGTKVM
jgi:hypothetical protein